MKKLSSEKPSNKATSVSTLKLSNTSTSPFINNINIYTKNNNINLRQVVFQKEKTRTQSQQKLK